MTVRGQRSSARSTSSSRSVRCRECEVVAITKYNRYHASTSCTSSSACMNREKSGFINIEELMAQVSLERAVSYYGITMPEIRRIGTEVRTRCFLTCGRHAETGDRALAIQPDHPAKIWRCHEAGCGRGGNLVSLCDLMKPGDNAGGKPRGERFKAILRDLQAMAAGHAPSTEHCAGGEDA